MNDEGLRVDLTAAQVDISFISTTINNLMTVDLTPYKKYEQIKKYHKNLALMKPCSA